MRLKYWQAISGLPPEESISSFRQRSRSFQENLVAEHIAIETYRDMVRHFGNKDVTTRLLLERILGQEEEHANDMHDLLVTHEGRPMLEK
jgi:bacterioferritin (cytochrome b1)